MKKLLSVLLTLSLIVSSFMFAIPAYAGEPIPAEKDLTLTSVAVNDGGLYAAVADLGGIKVSPDGKGWTDISSPTQFKLNSIVSVGKKFVAVGYYGTIVVSEDGYNWKLVNSGLQCELYSVVWNGKMFVAAGTNCTVLTSPDGYTWKVMPVDSGLTEMTINGLASDGTKVIAVTNRGDGLFSPDGIIWKNIPMFSMDTKNPFELKSIVYGKAGFVAVGTRGTIMTSPDGMVWNMALQGEPVTFNSVVWDGMNYLVTASDGVVRYFSDPNAVSAASKGLVSISSGITNLKLSDTQLKGDIYGIASNPNATVAVGLAGAIFRTNDLSVPWQVVYQPYVPSNAQLYDDDWSGRTYVAVGEHGVIRRSTDNGVTWPAVISYSPDQTLYGVAYGNGVFVTVGSNGTILRSTNEGASWTSITSGVLNTLYGVSYIGGRFIAVGQWGTVLISTNYGVSWTISSIYTSNPYENLTHITRNSSTYVVSSDAGRVYTSSNLSTWATYQVSPNPNPRALRSVIWNGTNQFVVVGDFATVYTSPNGTSWTRSTLGYTNRLNDVAWNTVTTYRYVTAGGDPNYGTDGCILASTNAVGWMNVPSPVRTSLNGAVYGSLYAIVGCYQRILTSPDGIAWTQRN